MANKEMEVSKKYINTVMKIIIFVTIIGMAMIPLLLDITWNIYSEYGSGMVGTLITMVPVMAMLGIILYLVKREMGALK